MRPYCGSTRRRSACRPLPAARPTSPPATERGTRTARATRGPGGPATGDGRATDPAIAAAGLALLTSTQPLRLQADPRGACPLRPSMATPRALVAAVARRVALVMEFHAGQTQWGAQESPGWRTWLRRCRTSRKTCIGTTRTRYSSRQQQEMTLGGVDGPLDAARQPRRPWPPCGPGCALGQRLHAGKECHNADNLGGYTLEICEERAAGPLPRRIALLRSAHRRRSIQWEPLSSTSKSGESCIPDGSFLPACTDGVAAKVNLNRRMLSP